MTSFVINQTVKMLMSYEEDKSAVKLFRGKRGMCR